MRRSFVQQQIWPTAGADDLAELALIDLSLQPRSGFKGRGTPEWLASAGAHPAGAEPRLASKRRDAGCPARPARSAAARAPIGHAAAS